MPIYSYLVPFLGPGETLLAGQPDGFYGKAGKEFAGTFIFCYHFVTQTHISKHLREILIHSLNSSHKLSDYKNKLSKRYFDHSKEISNNNLISMIEIINDTLINYQKVNDKRIHLELCLMKLASLDSIKKKSL